MSKKSKFPLSTPDREEFEEMYPHFKGFLLVFNNLKTESDRGAALILAGFLEELLRRALKGALLEEDYIDELFDGAGVPLGSFSGRINMAHALGLISDNARHDLHVIRGIRNDFAHEPAASFTASSIVNRCKNLLERAKAKTPREQYQEAALEHMRNLARSIPNIERMRASPYSATLLKSELHGDED